ncbi:MAG: ion transporter [Lachnospiraceae bacterium]|nr:ion transporter [Lachnospiraceae bacterium]
MSVSEKKRKRIFEIIQIGNREDFPSRAFDIFIVTAIVLNIAVLILDTFDQLSAYDGVFRTVEIVTILIFCVEYALRIWTADLLYPEEKKKSRAILKFIFSFDGLVDLLTILPFFFLSGMGAVRFLRVARIFHLFRINTQYESFQVITSVLKEKRNAILYSVFIIVVLILASSLTMYSVEHAAQPETFKNAFSGIWWSVSTVFTVGYGDIYPVTVLGRVMGVIITFLGVGAVAIPTGILSAGFVEHYSRLQRSVEAAEYKNSSAVILADKASPYAGRRVKEIEEMNAVCVTALIRGELVIVPEDTVRIEEGDVLLVMKL